MQLLVRSIDSSPFTFQNIEAKLKLSLEELIGIKDRKILKIFLLTECRSLINPYINLIHHYTSIKQEEKYEQVVSGFLERYGIFTEIFTLIIEKNKFSKTLCCIITYVWLEVLDDLEKEGKIQSDMLARNISDQMQTDLIRILDSRVNLS